MKAQSNYQRGPLLSVMAWRQRTSLPKRRLPLTPFSTLEQFIVTMHRNTQSMNTTKNTLVTFLFALAFAFVGAGQAQASVTVTPANASISADTAANAAVPAWITLGTISIVEGVTNDFSKGTNVTLVLKAPAG